MLICLDMRTGAGCGGKTVDNARFCEHCGQNLRFALMLHDAGTVVGRYRVVRVIGYGGFGAIYEAVGAAGEQVALKETFDTSSISTFKREFAVLSQLKHANLPRYMDMFEAQGNGYLVMEYVPGQSLQDVLDSQTELLPESQVLGYAIQLCDVLHYLHSQQPPILHRDVKPANIRLTPEGRIKLVDFGLLKQGGYQTRATIRGLGTPAYAPIEQYAHNQKATNPRSDLYALGATLYHLLTAKEPPSAPNRLTNSETLPPLPAGLSPHLKEAIIKAMSVMPDDRFADMETFKQALQGTQTVDEPFFTLITGQPTAQKKRETPVLPPISPLNRATRWLTQSLAKMRYGYVEPRRVESLFHLPFQVSGKVLKVIFHSDGDRQSLIGMTKQGIIYQWRVPDGQLLKILSLAVPDEVETMAYSPTGDTVATTSKDYIIRIWRTQDGQLLHQLRGHWGQVDALAYAPTGKVLASASNRDNQICFWHLSTGKLLRKIDDNNEVRKLAFSPDGAYLLGCKPFWSSYVWEMANNKQIKTINQSCSDVSDVAWQPGGHMLVYGRNDMITLRDAMTGESIATFQYKAYYFAGVTWHPDGKQVAVGTSKGMILIFMLGQNEPLYLCEGHRKRVLSLAYTPDGRFLASGGEDETVRLWALDRADVPATTSSHKKALEVVESPPWYDQKGVFAQQKNLEKLPNYVEAAHSLDLPHLVCDASGTVRTVGYDVDGKELISITEEGTLYRWRVEDGQLIKKQGLLAGLNRLTCAALSPDGQTVAIADKSLMVLIWRLEDGELLHRLHGHTNQITALAYMPDSQVLASSGGDDGTIRLWRVADGELLRTIQAKKPTICLKFSPSGQYLACRSSSHVHIWRIADQTWRREIGTGYTKDQEISWSPNEQFLLCGSGSDLHLWRVVDRQEMKRFKGHRDSVETVTWHPDGQLFLSASSDKTVRVWSLLAPHLRHVGEAHEKAIRSVAFSPDGRTFASGSEDGTVRLWFLPNNLDETDHHRSEEQSTVTKALETPIHEPKSAPLTTSLVPSQAIETPVAPTAPLQQVTSWFKNAFQPNQTTGSTKPLQNKLPMAANSKATMRLESPHIEPSISSLPNFVPAPDEMSLPHLLCNAEEDILELTYSPLGDKLSGIPYEGYLYQWRVSDGKLLQKPKWTSMGWMKQVAYSPTGETLATISSYGRDARILNAQTGQLIRKLYVLHGRPKIDSLCYSPNGKMLMISIRSRGFIEVWQANDGMHLYSHQPSRRKTYGAAFSPDSLLLATGSKHSFNKIHLYQADSGQLLRKTKQRAAAYSIAWHPNGEFFASGGNKKIVIWQTKDGELVQELIGHSNPVTHLLWHPSGKWLISGSEDKTVRVWAFQAPFLQYKLSHDEAEITKLAVSPNGRTLAVASRDKQVRLWLLPERYQSEMAIEGT